MKITCKTEYAEVVFECADFPTQSSTQYPSTHRESVSNNSSNMLKLIEKVCNECKEQSEAIYKLKTTF